MISGINTALALLELVPICLPLVKEGEVHPSTEDWDKPMSLSRALKKIYEGEERNTFHTLWPQAGMWTRKALKHQGYLE